MSTPFHSQAEETKSGHALPRANPLWILRAALLTLLVLTLARLNWALDHGRHITVWFDDSFSMHVLETEQSRTAIAAWKLGAALDEADPTKVRIRALSDHQEQLDASTWTAESRVAAIVHWAESLSPGNPQIPFILPLKTEHWLVTDGADGRLNAWMGAAQFSRTITVGSETENAAVTAIMARRSLQQTDLHEAFVQISLCGDCLGVPVGAIWSHATRQ